MQMYSKLLFTLELQGKITESLTNSLGIEARTFFCSSTSNNTEKFQISLAVLIVGRTKYLQLKVGRKLKKVGKQLGYVVELKN